MKAFLLVVVFAMAALIFYQRETIDALRVQVEREQAIGELWHDAWAGQAWPGRLSRYAQLGEAHE